MELHKTLYLEISEIIHHISYIYTGETDMLTPMAKYKVIAMEPK